MDLDQTTANAVVTQFTAPVIVTYALEYLKRSGWMPWLTMESKTLNRYVAAIAALLVSLGIHWEYNAAAGQLVITGLFFAQILQSLPHIAWDWAKQFVFQQLVYDGVIAKSTPPAVPAPVNRPMSSSPAAGLGASIG